MQKELRRCLLKRFFQSRTSLFSFTPPPISMLFCPQNLLDNLTYSTLKREGGIDRISLITREEADIVANVLWDSQPFCTGSSEWVKRLISGNICYTFAKLSEHTFSETINWSVLKNVGRSRLSKFGRFLLLCMHFWICRIIFAGVHFL